MAVGGEQGVAWQPMGVAADSSVRAGISHPSADGALHTPQTGKSMPFIRVYVMLLIQTTVFFILMHFYALQVRSAYSQPETPLRASNPTSTSNSWRSVNNFACKHTSVDSLI